MLDKRMYNLDSFDFVDFLEYFSNDFLSFKQLAFGFCIRAQLEVDDMMKPQFLLSDTSRPAFALGNMRI